MQKKIRLLLFLIIALPITLVLLFLAYATINEWRPSKIENIDYSAQYPTYIKGDTITMLLWNIGYGGLGDDMDFFMDGGEKSVTSKARTRENVDSIKSFLSQYNSVDFILLQEVDSISKRNYDINLYGEICSQMKDFYAYYAVNYQSSFVPIPLKSPIGQVKSGLLTLSKYKSTIARRISLPSEKSYPVRLFHLKRALLYSEFALEGGDKISIINVHNSAFDDGTARGKEMEAIKQLIDTTKNFIVAGDWNSTPPNYKASREERENEYFSPVAIEENTFGMEVVFAVDPTSKSARYNYEPYRANHTTTTLIDFAISSTNIRAIEVEIIDLGFKNSDHNPVFYKFVVEH